MSPQFNSIVRWGMAFVFVGITIAVLLRRVGILESATGTTLVITLIGLIGGLLAWRLNTRTFRPPAPSEAVPGGVIEAMDSLTDGLLILDHRERIVLANKAFARMIQVDASALHDQCVTELAWVVGVHERGSMYPWSGSDQPDWQCAEQLMQFQLPGGQTRTFSINATRSRDLGKRPYGIFVTFRDVTDIERHRAELSKKLLLLRSSRDHISRKNRELEVLAAQDPLTECLNRRSFMQSFQRSWDSAERDDRPLACLIMDIDHFKQVNDNYGHPTGDRVLKRVAQAIRESVNEDSLVCRYGGEEFCIAIRDADANAAVRIAEDLRYRIESIRFYDPSQLRLTASIGVATRSSAAADIHDMIHHADQALYRAKRQGRNQTLVYDAKLDSDDLAPHATPADERQPAEVASENGLALDQLREINDLLNEISRTASVRSPD